MEIAKDKRVLVIDDNARALEAISALLQSWGLNVVNAQSLPAALAQTGAHPPDLIISDYHLQNEITGIDIIEHLRSKFDAKIPAFLISGDTALVSGHRASMAGYVVLHKPVEQWRCARQLSASSRGMRKAIMICDPIRPILPWQA